MIQDIKDGVDFHCKRLAYAEQLPYEEVVALCATSPEWKLKRKKAKTISFQKAYGAQPASIAKECGLPEEVVKRVFDSEDIEYPEIKQFYEMVLESVQRTRTVEDELMWIRNKATGERIQMDGEYKAYGTYQSVTGKLYTFDEKAVLTRRGVFRYFSMPDIQNYPVQGTAADIVACQVGRLWKELINHRDKCLLINEVHDSVILDVKKSHLDLIIEKVSTILQDVSGSFQKQFGLKFNVPIKVDHCYGSTWKAAKESE